MSIACEMTQNFPFLAFYKFAWVLSVQKSLVSCTKEEIQIEECNERLVRYELEGVSHEFLLDVAFTIC